MSISDFDPDILNDFLTEGAELLDDLDSDLVALEDTPEDEELLNRIFRALHTVKGSASFLAITNLVEFTHAAEDALNVIRKGEVSINEVVMDALLKSVDVVRVQFKAIEEGLEPEPGPRDLIKALNRITAGNISSETSEAPAPAEPAEPVAEESAEPASAGSAATMALAEESGVEIQTLELPESKADLFEYMVEDLNEAIGHLDEQIVELADITSRSAAAEHLAETAEALNRSVGFFEIEPISSAVSLFEIAADHVDHLPDDALKQVLPRLRALVAILREQSEGLSEKKVIVRPASMLHERIIDLLLGNSIAAKAEVSPEADVLEVWKIDGVITEEAAAERAASLAGESTETSTSPAETVEDAPASTGDVSTESSPGSDAATEGQSAEAEEGKTTRATAGKINKPEATIRVEVSRLESLLNLVGELVIQKNRIAALSRQLNSSGGQVDSGLAEAIELASGDLDHVTSDIQVGVMRTRMQPLDKLFGKYPRMVRDLARGTNKKIELVIVGGDTEVDKSVLEKLGDPLVHILRNSADHGIEMPEARIAAGKPELGTIRIAAQHQGSHVLVQVIDDGAGLNRKRIGSLAVDRGIVTTEELEQMTDKEIIKLIMAPGFSTAESVSDLSGRGVGMDVVKTNIQQLNGMIDLDSVEGKGTTLSIKIPLTVAIMNAMMVGVGEEMYAVPLTNIIEIVKPDESQVSTIHGHRVMTLRDRVLPLVSLATQFDRPELDTKSPFAVVVSVGEQRVGLMVTRLIGQQEIVIKPLDDMFDRADAVSGATVRDDGGVSLILDVDRMVASLTPSMRHTA